MLGALTTDPCLAQASNCKVHPRLLRRNPLSPQQSYKIAEKLATSVVENEPAEYHRQPSSHVANVPCPHLQRNLIGETLGPHELLIPSHRALEARHLLNGSQNFAEEPRSRATPSDS